MATRRHWEYDRIEGATWEEFEDALAAKDAEGWEVVGFSVIDKGNSYYSIALLRRAPQRTGSSVGFASVPDL
jgi:hypothetical protein